MILCFTLFSEYLTSIYDVFIYIYNAAVEINDFGKVVFLDLMLNGIY